MVRHWYNIITVEQKFLFKQMFTHATEREFPLDIKSQFDKTSAITFVYSFLSLYRSWKTGKVLEVFFWHFPGLSSPGKRLQFLECPKNLLNSSNKVFRIYACNVFRPLGEFGLKSWDWKGLRWNLKYWKSLWIFFWRRVQTLSFACLLQMTNLPIFLLFDSDSRSTERGPCFYWVLSHIWLSWLVKILYLSLDPSE